MEKKRETFGDHEQIFVVVSNKRLNSTWMSQEVRINGLFHLLINEYIGVITHLLTIH